MGTADKRNRADSSSDEDEEARRVKDLARKRRRIEHAQRAEERKRERERDQEQRKLARMSERERKQFLKQKQYDEEMKEIRNRTQRIQQEQEQRASRANKEEEEYNKKQALWQKTHKPWSFDDDDAEDEVPPDTAMDAADDPLANFLNNIRDKDETEIIGVNNQQVATLDEVTNMQRNQLRKLKRSEQGGEPEDDGADDDEADAASFIKALAQAAKGLAADATPTTTTTPDTTASPAPEPTTETTDVTMSNDEDESRKAGVTFDFDEDDFQDRSYGISKQEVRVKDLRQVNHSNIDYLPFRKDLYVAAKAVKALTPEEISTQRKNLDAMKVRGDRIPPPVTRWEQCGFSDGILNTLASLQFVQPSAIQAQTVPIVMSGRDMIGVARTGSGKTLAYLLPMFRHILDQLPIVPMGPVAIILVPTRELATQVSKVAKQFTTQLKLRLVTAFGGSPIAEQIAECRRGVHVVIGTPGRIIDLMVANKGKVLDTYRMTFCVLDEADRLFDQGFGPQVAKILNNVRPDRQTLMFSATFPKQVEAGAKRFLNDDAIEVVVGGKCNASTNVTQHVECFEDGHHKYQRLLQLLGEWYNKGLILIFTERQDEVDALWEMLDKSGYGELSGMLHAGMDHLDRELTMHSFKMGEKHILLATSVAARGIDVNDLELVVNYRVPDHIEDYIHRIGRTGRAQKRGKAYTFYMIGEDEKHATWLVKALEGSQNEVPEELQLIANKFWEDRNNGLIKDFRAQRYSIFFSIPHPPFLFKNPSLVTTLQPT